MKDLGINAETLAKFQKVLATKKKYQQGKLSIKDEEYMYVTDQYVAAGGKLEGMSNIDEIKLWHDFGLERTFGSGGTLAQTIQKSQRAIIKAQHTDSQWLLLERIGLNQSTEQMNALKMWTAIKTGRVEEQIVRKFVFSEGNYQARELTVKFMNNRWYQQIPAKTLKSGKLKPSKWVPLRENPEAWGLVQGGITKAQKNFLDEKVFAKGWELSDNPLVGTTKVGGEDKALDTLLSITQKYYYGGRPRIPREEGGLLGSFKTDSGKVMTEGIDQLSPNLRNVMRTYKGKMSQSRFKMELDEADEAQFRATVPDSNDPFGATKLQKDLLKAQKEGTVTNVFTGETGKVVEEFTMPIKTAVKLPDEPPMTLAALPKSLWEKYREYEMRVAMTVEQETPSMIRSDLSKSAVVHRDAEMIVAESEKVGAKIKADVERIGYEATERKWGRTFSTEKAWADFKSNYSVSGERIISQTEGEKLFGVSLAEVDKSVAGTFVDFERALVRTESIGSYPAGVFKVGRVVKKGDVVPLSVKLTDLEKIEYRYGGTLAREFPYVTGSQYEQQIERALLFHFGGGGRSGQLMRETFGKSDFAGIKYSERFAPQRSQAVEDYAKVVKLIQTKENQLLKLTKKDVKTIKDKHKIKKLRSEIAEAKLKRESKLGANWFEYEVSESALIESFKLPATMSTGKEGQHAWKILSPLFQRKTGSAQPSGTVKFRKLESGDWEVEAEHFADRLNGKERIGKMFGFNLPVTAF
jgi:hypothetical protein